MPPLASLLLTAVAWRPLSPPPPADISLLGEPKEVARLLLPPGATVVGLASTKVAQPPKDTGTVLGTIERDPVTYYRCVLQSSLLCALLPVVCSAVSRRVRRRATSRPFFSSPPSSVPSLPPGPAATTSSSPTRRACS